ncbi:5-hydroxytryptamine receptor 3A-like [Pelobates fuscus]|uniref:5-hydroxytryptamine receptor 3A-like n=1 Tax=Pelobates fuscus TaxID=191477 RepID=UPI002FE491D1
MACVCESSLDPFMAPAMVILNFLAELFTKSYQTINVFPSTISLAHVLSQGSCIGKDPLFHWDFWFRWISFGYAFRLYALRLNLMKERGSLHKEDNNIILKPSRNSSQLRNESLRYFFGFGEWEIQDITVEQDNVDSRSQLIYRVIMKRQPGVYVLCLILPTLSLLFMNLLSYFMPNAYQEKIAFKVTVLLGVSVLSLILNDFIPSSSKQVPTIVIFFIGTLALMMIEIIEIFLILHIGNYVHCKELAKTRNNLLSKEPFSSEPASVNEEPVTGDGMHSLLGRIQRDMELVREQILAIKKAEQLENDNAAFLRGLDKLVFYIHLLLATLFYTMIILKWSL